MFMGLVKWYFVHRAEFGMEYVLNSLCRHLVLWLRILVYIVGTDLNAKIDRPQWDLAVACYGTKIQKRRKYIEKCHSGKCESWILCDALLPIWDIIIELRHSQS